MLREAEVFSLRKNEMITERNAEQLSGCGKLLRAGDITLAGHGVARRVVVGNDDARSTIGYGIGEDFAWVCLNAIE